jgi:hypothetical protein
MAIHSFILQQKLQLQWLLQLKINIFIFFFLLFIDNTTITKNG